MSWDSPQGRIVYGFAAGALAVLIFHQGMVLILHLLGQVPNFPWSLRANPWGVPQILSSMFWGGVWGVLFAFVIGRLPYHWPLWIKGVALGLVLHVILGNWIVLALARGQAMFAGGQPPRMLISALIGTSFGLGWALIHAALKNRFAR
jgi:cytochrome c biogenesis protein CcdA